MMRRVIAELQERFGHQGVRVARAPGRVNLIGEHTDYNDGFVFPIAIDRNVVMAFASNPYPEIRGYSVDFDEERSAGFEEITPPSRQSSWFDYVSGMAWVLRRDGLSIQGMDFVVAGDIPMGAGLSSSAALELATSRALYSISGVPWDPRGAALAGQKVENDFIGLDSGIMDQIASALSREGSAMLLDCRDLTCQFVKLPEELAVVVMDTGTRRSVAASAYNERRAQCQQALAAIREVEPFASSLRDLHRADLEPHRSRMDDVVYRRALHVVTENERTLEMADALVARDLPQIAELMAQSHESLRSLYEVSSDALDQSVAAALLHPACCGARMTGAGFGGCAVALVASDGVADFVREIEGAIPGGEVYPCVPVSGVTLLSGRTEYEAP